MDNMVSNVCVEIIRGCEKIQNHYFQYINDDNIIYFSFSVTTYKFLKLQYYLRVVHLVL